MSKRRSGRRRKCCRSYVIGKGKFWDGVKNILKKTKILSTAASLIPGVGGALSNIVSNVGYGRRRKHRRGGKMDLQTFKKLYGKNTNNLKKVISSGPSSIPNFKKTSGGRRHRRHRRSSKHSSSSSNNYDNRYIDNKIRVL